MCNTVYIIICKHIEAFDAMNEDCCASVMISLALMIFQIMLPLAWYGFNMKNNFLFSSPYPIYVSSLALSLTSLSL